jgi:3-oxoacyl-[acyl-carrier protein] reductase
MDPKRFANRVALVTGASRGIGRSVSLRLAAEGAAVAVNYRVQADAALQVVSEIESAGGRTADYQADVTDRAALEAMVRSIAADLGPVDILVNNAGLLYTAGLLDYDEDQFERMWRTNVTGVLQATAAVAPSMIERGYGRVINLSSIAAIGTAYPGTTLYAATKGAVQILTKRFAYELGPSGITVNAVLPGFTVTDMVSEGKTPEEMEEAISDVSRKAMLRRVGSPEDIAQVVSFLASEESSFMTGQFLVADGGRMDFLSHT